MSNQTFQVNSQQEGEGINYQQLHGHLKNWYNEEKERMFGPLPRFWQELQSWDNLRNVTRAYENDQTSNYNNNDQNQEETNQVKSSKNRWGLAPSTVSPTSICAGYIVNSRDTSIPAIVAKMSLKEKKLLLARLNFDEVNYQLTNVVEIAKKIDEDPNRPPSPDPIYDSHGKRVNTREVGK